MSEVRRSLVIFNRRASIQCSLYARLTSTSGPPSRRSRLRSYARLSSNWFASPSLTVSPFPAGRWSGVLVASFQTPCRSGSPHGVFFTAYALVAFAAGAAFAAAGAGFDSAVAGFEAAGGAVWARTNKYGVTTA